MTYLRTLIITALITCMPVAASADGAQSLGWGSMFNNDALGDGKDRWRSASFTLSHLRGDTWNGQRPERIGALIEYRFRAEIIAPVSVAAPTAADRLYVGALSFGAHTHFQKGATQMSLGLDLVFVGEQTKVDEFQDGLHGIFASGDVNVGGAQVANAIYPTLTFEAGRDFAVGASGRLHPFVELQAGAETLARVGADLTLGQFGKGGLQLRDSVTGQIYNGIKGDLATGTSVMVGGDVAYVADSQYLDSPGIVAEDMRFRLRAGLHQQWKRGSLFYGATYLSEEYKSQPEGQVVGSLNMNFQF